MQKTQQLEFATFDRFIHALLSALINAKTIDETRFAEYKLQLKQETITAIIG